MNVALENSRSRLFMREDVRLDSTKKYQEAKEEELKSQMAGTSLEVKNDKELEDTLKGERKARQRPNTGQGGAPGLPERG